MMSKQDDRARTLSPGLALLLLQPAGWADGTLPPEPQAGTAIVHPVDGAIMLYVPSGEFVMGLDEADAVRVARNLGWDDEGKLWAFEAYPKRTLNIPGYFMDQHEVTVGQYEAFIRATGRDSRARETLRHFGRPDEEILPAGGVPWDEARAYARWAGKDLPTEAQWEKAARGTDGRLYPWGNEAPTPDRGHFGSVGGSRTDGRPARMYTWVGRYPQGASPYGILDLLGNQYEWTREMLTPYPGNPQADRMKDYASRVVCLRGGSWYHGWVGFYAAKRFGLKPDETYLHIGFRTVWTPPEGYFASEAFQRDRAAVAERRAWLAERQRRAAEAEDKTSAAGKPAGPARRRP